MEFLSVANARVGWLFDYGELNPQGKDFLVHLIDWLKDTYSFEKYPDSLSDFEAETKSLAFKIGSFQVRPDIFIVVELNIYSDGIQANSWSSTDDTEAFLHDVLSNAAKEFHLNYAEKIIQHKTYVSEVAVRYEQPLAAINPNAIKIADAISHLTGRDCELGGIQFWFDTRLNPPLGPFRIEKKLNAPLHDNRYFSSAPLRTKDHISLLESFEHILGGQQTRP
jgi:hypothetical protein